MVGREIGSFEFQILATLMAKRSDAYGLTIRDRIKETFEREVSVGAIYTSLNRLEDKGFVSSKWGNPPRNGAAGGNVCTKSLRMESKLHAVSA